MKKYIPLLLITCLLLACENDKEHTLSTSTEIKSIHVSSLNSSDVEKTNFYIDKVKHEIYNIDSLPQSSIIKMLKFNITADTKSTILMNNQSWNGIDSVNYASSIIITVLAENRDFHQDYILKFNKKKNNFDGNETYNANASGRISGSNYTVFFDVHKQGLGYLTNGEVGSNQWGLWYTAPFDCIVSIDFNVNGKNGSKSKFEILDQLFNRVYSRVGVTYSETFETYLRRGRNVKIRVKSEDINLKEVSANVNIKIRN